MAWANEIVGVRRCGVVRRVQARRTLRGRRRRCLCSWATGCGRSGRSSSARTQSPASQGTASGRAAPTPPPVPARPSSPAPRSQPCHTEADGYNCPGSPPGHARERLGRMDTDTTITAKAAKTGMSAGCRVWLGPNKQRGWTIGSIDGHRATQPRKTSTHEVLSGGVSGLGADAQRSSMQASSHQLSAQPALQRQEVTQRKAGGYHS